MLSTANAWGEEFCDFTGLNLVIGGVGGDGGKGVPHLMMRKNPPCTMHQVAQDPVFHGPWVVSWASGAMCEYSTCGLLCSVTRRMRRRGLGP